MLTHPLILLTFLCAPGIDQAARAETPAPITEVPRLATLSFSNLDFEDGANGWRTTDENVDFVRGAGRGKTTALRISHGGSASRTLTVSRGPENMKGQRYLVTAWVKSKTKGARGTISLHGSTWRSTGSLQWESIEAIADTAVRTPGSLTQPLALSFAAGKPGTVLFDEVRVYRVPSYGIHVRFKVVEPAEGRFNGQAYIIRRHRDTSHHDSARHRYHAGVGGLGGPEGVRAGLFSPWSDLRRHLFGTSNSTVSFSIRKQDGALPNRPLTVTIELSLGPIVAGEEEAETSADNLLELTEKEPDPASEFEEKKGPVEDPTAKGVFFRQTHRSGNGLFAFLLPEKDLPPSRFLAAIRSIDQEIAERHRWALEALPPL